MITDDGLSRDYQREGLAYGPDRMASDFAEWMAAIKQAEADLKAALDERIVKLARVADLVEAGNALDAQLSFLIARTHLDEHDKGHVRDCGAPSCQAVGHDLDHWREVAG